MTPQYDEKFTNAPKLPQREGKSVQSSGDEDSLPKLTKYNPKVSSHCTIHRPTLRELRTKTFSSYIREVVLPTASVEYEDDEDDADYSQEPMELREGLAKVVLPKELSSVETTGRGESWQKGTQLGDFVLKSPMKQHVRGINGVYQYAFTDAKPMTISEFREEADSYLENQVGHALKRRRREGMNEAEQEDTVATERLFWKRLGPTMPAPYYGADQEGSLFKDSAAGWSCAHLDSCLQVLSDELPGVTTPYIYAGMWATVFCAHTEDMNLLSMNIMHAGAPKFWYAVAEPDAPRFAALCAHYFSPQTCPEFMRHKRCLLSPAVLKKAGIRYQTCIQYPGEAVLTMPGSFHFGFNAGFNVAEATNFAVPEWLPFGRQAKVCMCKAFSVRIELDQLTHLLEEYARDQEGEVRKLTWKAWGRKKRKQQEKDELKKKRKLQKDAETVSELKAKRSEALSDQQKKGEFWVEVTVAPTEKGKKKPGKGKGGKGKRVPTTQKEIWHLATPVKNQKQLTPKTKVLCLISSTIEVVETGPDNETKIVSRDDELCYKGAVAEIDDEYVRVRFPGLPKSEDAWLLWSSPTLFLDGGEWGSDASAPERHFWTEMDSKDRAIEAEYGHVMTEEVASKLKKKPRKNPLQKKQPVPSSVKEKDPASIPSASRVSNFLVSCQNVVSRSQENSSHQFQNPFMIPHSTRPINPSSIPRVSYPPAAAFMNYQPDMSSLAYLAAAALQKHQPRSFPIMNQQVQRLFYPPQPYQHHAVSDESAGSAL